MEWRWLVSRAILGIDIGSNALKIASYDGRKTSRLVEEPMPDQLVRGGNIVSAEAMSAFLKETLKKYKLFVKQAAVILPASQVFVQQVELPFMTEAQLRLNLPYEFRDFITEEKDKYVYDYALIEMVKNEEGENVKMRLLASAVGKEVIREYRDLCRFAGLKLVAAVPYEVAYRNLLRRIVKARPEEADYEHCLIDLGHTGYRMYFFHGAVFEAVRTGDRGGAAVDEMLSGILNVDIHIAHAHKESDREGELEQPQVVDYFQGLGREIQRAVNFYSYNNPDKELKGIWVCGGGSRVAELTQEISELLDLTVHQADELADLFVEQKEEQEEKERTKTCAAAIGAALSEYGRTSSKPNAAPSRMSINMMVRERQSVRPAILIPAVLATVLLAGIFSKFAVSDRLLRAYQAEKAAEEAEQHLARMEQALMEYEEVSTEYARYFSDALKSSDMPQDCMEILSLVERKLMTETRLASVVYRKYGIFTADRNQPAGSVGSH